MRFFALTFALAAPFYVLNALAYLDVFGSPDLGPVYIAIFTVTPIASAAWLTLRRRGWGGVRRLLRRAFDFRRIPNHRWYAAIVLLPVLIYVLSLGAAVLSGVRLPTAMMPVAALPVALPFFFILAAAEEVGWMGYAFEPMQARHGALPAALGLGVVWALWHVPFFVFMMPDAIVVGAQVVALLSTRVLMAWLFNKTGSSVFAAILFHAMTNVAMAVVPNANTVDALGATIFCGLLLSAAVVVALLR